MSARDSASCLVITYGESGAIFPGKPTGLKSIKFNNFPFVFQKPSNRSRRKPLILGHPTLTVSAF